MRRKDAQQDALGAPQNALIYTRVSTVEQGREGTSLGAQLDACERMAAQIGAQVVGVHAETKSGALYLTRGEMQSALERIERGEAQILILAKLDRTGREVESLRDIRRRIERAGGQLIFADGMQFEQNAVGNLMFTQLGAFAEFERELIRERTQNGKIRVAQAGIMPARALTAFGYTLGTHADVIRGRCAANEVGIYKVCEEQAQWVPEIFERVASGESLRSIARWLTQTGARTQGRLGHAPARQWAGSSIAGIIKNPIYYGEAAWGKTRRVTDETRAVSGVSIHAFEARPATQWIRIPAPALVDRALWERANQTLREGRERRSGRTDRRYLLSGLGRCPLCGTRLCVISWKKSPSKEGSERSARYKCFHSHTQKKTGRENRCTFASVSAPQLENLVLRAVEGLYRTPALVEIALAEFKKRESSRKRRGESSPQNLERLKREFDSLNAKEARALELLIEWSVEGRAVDALKRSIDDIASKKTEVESKIAALNLQTPVIPSLETWDTPLAVLFDEAIPASEKTPVLFSLIETVYPRLDERQKLKSVEIRLKDDSKIPVSAPRFFWILTLDTAGICTLQIRPSSDFPLDVGRRSQFSIRG